MRYAPKFVTLIFLCLIFLHTSHAQDEKWIDISAEGIFNGDYTKKSVQIATGERYVAFHPLNEVSLWLYANIKGERYGRKVHNFVMSHIRFKTRFETFTVLSTYGWSYEKPKPKMVEILNKVYENGWREFFTDNPLSREIWKFVKSYFE